MTQAEALTILKTGASVFLSGEPGAGKTHTINEYVRYLRDRNIEPAITASTGIAATHIGGMTIHSWSGIGIRRTLDRYDLDKLASNEYIVKRVRRTNVLIIDEVSMLHADMLDMVDAVCREVRQVGEPFGGMQVILVGDFFQLPPISKQEEPTVRQGSLMQNSPSTVFAYGASAWERLKPVVCYLSEQHRQDDQDFLSVLSAIRKNAVADVHIDHILGRQVAYDDVPENITKLFSHNANVDEVNSIALGRISSSAKSFEMTSGGNDMLVATLKKGCLSPETLELKVGASVMFTKNNPKEGFVNGTLGTVVDFDRDNGYPVVMVRGSRSITAEPMDWTVEENGKVRAEITQVPLRLAWAMTVHKSQGMSLDAAVMDLSGVFEYGQGYVALSRVRRLSGLYILGMSDRALQVHPEILAMDETFRRMSDEAATAFAKLSADDIKKMHDNFVTACGGKILKKEKKEKKEKKAKTGAKLPEGEWQKRLDTMREKHPNAYRPWTDEQDEALKQSFEDGAKIAELVHQFGRKRGAITARLEKLGLIEAD